ncbi:MAG: cobalamin-dependent protein, partial [Nanoarchaeota archaeon]
MTKIALLTPNLMGMQNGINRIQPSLGVGYLAGVLRQRGHEVFVRDTALEDYNRMIPNSDGKTVTIGESEEKTADWLSKVNPDYVGISVLFSNLAAHAHEIAAISKKIVPKAKVILGGNHVTNSALDFNYFASKGKTAKLDAIQDPNVDFAMRGEVDFDLADLVDALSHGRNPYETHGLIYKTKNGEIKINETSGRLKNMDDLPFPARDLMNMEGYFNIGRFHSANPRSNRVGSVMASRGCPEHCSFCTTPETWGNVVRWRSPENVAEEIKGLKENFKVGEIHFEDDTLTANSVNLEKLCGLIEPFG